MIFLVTNVINFKIKKEVNLLLRNTKIKILSIVLGSTVFLTGCFPNDRDDAIKAAQAAYAKGDLVTAHQQYVIAMSLNDFSEKEENLRTTFENISNTLYGNYINEGNSAFEQKDFEKALESFENANTISSHDPNVSEMIQTIKDRASKQAKLDEYVLFVNNVFKDSNILLRTFNKDMEAKVVGSITDVQFKNNIKKLLPQSNDIIAEIDDSITKIDGDITGVHAELLKLIEFQHRTFVMAIEGSELSELAERHAQTKIDQTNLIQSLQSYAASKELAYKVQLNKEDAKK